MKLVIELSAEELDEAERQGVLTVVVDAAELHQGLLIQQRRITHLEAPSRQHFAQPTVLPRDREASPADQTGPWLTVYLGPDEQEGASDGADGDA